MRLVSPGSGGTVDATGDEAKRLIACGFVPAPDEKPPAKPKTATRKRKTTSK